MKRPITPCEDCLVKAKCISGKYIKGDCKLYLRYYQKMEEYRQYRIKWSHTRDMIMFVSFSIGAFVLTLSMALCFGYLLANIL